MIQLPASARRAGTTALVLGAVVLSSATQAQEPLALPDFSPSYHVPALPPPPGTAADASPKVADGTYFPGRFPVLREGPVWEMPRSRTDLMTTFVMPGFTAIGPSPIANGAGGFETASPVSGRIVAVAVDAADTTNNTLYVAPAGGGVWKTTNGGMSWTALTDNLPDLAMGSLAIDPSNHNTIFAGSGEANFSGDSRYGVGLYKSTDGGSSWTVYTGPGNAFYRLTISRIVVDPSNPNNVYLTTARGANGVGGGYGVYKSTDGGVTWSQVFNPGAACTDLAIDLSTPQTLYAAVGEIFGSSANGIYKSTNSGASWSLLTGFPSGSNVGRVTMAISPSNPQVLYADYAQQVSSGTGGLGGFFSTTNGGATWTQAPASTDGTGNTGVPNFLGTQGWYDNAIVVSPINASEVYAAGVINYNAGGPNGKIVGLIGSFNGGANWYDYSTGAGRNGPHTDHHALAFTPDGGKLLNGNDGGLWRLENPNVTPTAYNSNNNILWTDLNTNLAITQFTGIALHPTDPTVAYGGSQDNGTEKYTGTTSWTQVRGGDGGFTRVDQSNPNTVYHEYYGISLERSDNGGANWTNIAGTTGINPSDPVIDEGDDPAAFYVPYVLDPANQQRIIYGTNHVYESTNKGAAFSTIGTPGTNGFNPGNGTVTTLGVLGPTIYAAVGSSLYVTTNDGASWGATTAVPGGGAIGDIYVNPNDNLDAIVTRASFGGGHVIRTNDGGVTWTDISANLPNEPFNAIKADKRSGTLYAGGDDGVYSSPDYGNSWTKANLPNVQVVDLAVSPGAGIVGAGTHGRGVFEAPLSTSVAASNIYVTATLSRSGGQLLATVVLKNSGNGDVTNAVLNAVTLNGVACTLQTTGANAVGTVPANGQALAVVYVCPATATGTRIALRTTGNSDQGSFGSAAKITAP